MRLLLISGGTRCSVQKVRRSVPVGNNGFVRFIATKNIIYANSVGCLPARLDNVRVGIECGCHIGLYRLTGRRKCNHLITRIGRNIAHVSGFSSIARNGGIKTRRAITVARTKDVSLLPGIQKRRRILVGFFDLPGVFELQVIGRRPENVGPKRLVIVASHIATDFIVIVVAFALIALRRRQLDAYIVTQTKVKNSIHVVGIVLLVARANLAA